ncbi:hypothetical protein D3C73_1314870 [compost metagenome]
MLARGIPGHVDPALVGEHRADVDDFTVASFQEVAAGDLRQQEHRVQVQVDDIEPVFFAVVFGWSTADHACAVDKNVYFPGKSYSFVEHSLKLGVIAQIACDAECFYAKGFGCGYCFVTCIEGSGDHVCARFCESKRNPLSKTLGSTGYDCCFACQTE